MHERLISLISGLLSAVPCAEAPSRAEALPEVPAALRLFVDRRSKGDSEGAIAALAPKDRDGTGPRFCGGPLEPWCALLRAEALLDARAFEAALASARAARLLAPGPTPVARRAFPVEVRALIGLGRAGDALALLRDAPARRRDLLIEAREAAGDAAGALALWREIFVDDPAWPSAGTARAKLEAAGALDRLTPADWAARAERLVGVGLAAEALQSAEHALAAKPRGEPLVAAMHARARALAKLKRLDEADAAFTALAGLDDPGAQKLLAAIGLERGRLALAADAHPEARARFKELETKYPKAPQAAEAAFLGAWTFFNAGAWTDCADAFARVAARHRPRADEALWYQGYCRHLAGDDAGATAAFDALARRSADLAPQALYWRGRLSPKPAEALASYRRAIAAAPTGWYAWLSRRRLAAAGAAAEPLALAAAEPGTAAPEGPEELRAVLLARAGLGSEAREEIEARRASRQSPAQAEHLANLCANLGMFDRAYAIARAALGRSVRAPDRERARGLLFPRAYRASVEAAAKAEDLDPYFAWAIMRRESGFDPAACSPAQAHGLMQLLLPVAKRLASETGRPAPTVAALRTPEAILPLASHYLAQLVGTFGHGALAAAAYNGGEAAVQRWLGQGPALPLDEFVERIPYKETRLYVKGVLGDYFTYRALWKADGPAVPFSMEVATKVDAAVPPSHAE